VTIRRLNSNLEILWKTEYKNEFQNLSGALWTSRVACTNDYLLIVDPLTNVLSYISLIDGKRVPYHFSASKDSWSFKMDSTYSTWPKNTYVPIKARLGEIMYSWQNMSCQHIESVYNVDSLFLILNTENFQSEVHLISPILGELLHVRIDSAGTLPLLAKRLNFRDLRATYLKRQIINDTMYYDEQIVDLKKYFTIPCYIEGDLFCQGCIDADYAGIIVFKSRSRVEDVAQKHKFSKMFPKAYIYFVEDTNSFGFNVNELIYISFEDFANILRRSKKNINHVH